ncbi:hypothetical protein LDENG_00246620 [Lucifuga dentata]|nr:hypothetical protein LDENG_00246620 [Lucifuga dentata]
MDESYNNSDIQKDSTGEPGLSADLEASESLPSEEEENRHSFCTVTEDLTANGPWSKRSISRSLQQAETLLRSTFNPGLKWLFHGPSQDEEEEEEEASFVVAHNLVSRSSSRLLRLQQVMLAVAPQWQLVRGVQTGPPQHVCVKGLAAECGVLQSSCVLQECFGALWRLLEQRSVLLFTHEYSRRLRSAAAYVSRLSRRLEDQLRNADLTHSLVMLNYKVFCSCTPKHKMHVSSDIHHV